MNKYVIIFGVLIVITAAIIIGLYFFYEKPEQEKPPEMHNLSIRFYNNVTKSQVDSDYIISRISLSDIYKQGRSTKNDFVRELIPVNTTFRVLNNNKNNQSYYTNYQDFYDVLGVGKIFRIEIPLTKVGELTIEKNSVWNIENPDNPFVLFVKSTGEVRNIGFCLRWSDNIVSVTEDHYKVSEVPTRYKDKVDRCYDTSQTLNNNSLAIFLKYKTFGNLDIDDYIKVIVIDGDVQYGNVNEVVREDGDGNDIALPDVEYIIK